MTQQEAEALSAKFSQIWGCEFQAIENFGQYKWAAIGENGIYAVSLRLITKAEVLIGCYTSSLAQYEREFGPSIRKYYWLSGINIECSAHEQLEWSQWLQEQKERDLIGIGENK